jgi:phosphatidate cytidylyltransferase
MSLRRRLPTAVILLVLIGAVVQWAPPAVFFVLLQVFVVAALLEFYGLARRRKVRVYRTAGIAVALLLELPWVIPDLMPDMALFLGLLGLGMAYLFGVRSVEDVVGFPSAIALTFFGAVFIGFTMGYVYGLRADFGPPALYFFLSVIIVGDSGAMLFGKLLGRRKMAPWASPNKTWEGALGGLLASAAAAAGAGALFFNGKLDPAHLLGGVLLGIVSQASDPVESLFKRAAGVKDSSNLLPGHGGFLDRMDSYLLAAPFFYYYLLWWAGGRL